MTDKELVELENLFGVLRRARVKSFESLEAMTGNKFSVEFLPEAPDTQPKPFDLSPDVELCDCGHPMHAHVNGLCIHGCNDECLPKETTQ